MVEEHYNNWIVDHYKKEQNRHRASWRNQYLKAKHQNTQTTIKIGCLFRLHYAFLDRERVIIFQQQHLKSGPVLRKTNETSASSPQFFFKENKAIKSIKKTFLLKSQSRHFLKCRCTSNFQWSNKIQPELTQLKMSLPLDESIYFALMVQFVSYNS